MKKFPQLACRNPRRTERKHFALSQISSPYDLAIGKLIIIENKQNKKEYSMILPSGRNNKLTLELQETKINALEELDKTLFESNFNTEVRYESKLDFPHHILSDHRTSTQTCHECDQTFNLIWNQCCTQRPYTEVCWIKSVSVEFVRKR